MPYPTPPKPVPLRLTCRRFFVPDDLQVIGVMFGQLYLASEEDYWSDDSDWSPHEITQAILEGLKISNQDEECSMICTVQWTVVNTIPDGWLIADGSIVLIDDYPDYAATCDPLLIVSGTEVALPDLTDRVPVGSGSTYQLDDMGGSTVETLTTDQMPTHSHTQNPHAHSTTTHVDGVLPEGGLVPIPAVLPIPIPSVTGLQTATNNNTGGGNSHNNMQPYYALKPIVRVQL